MTQQERRSGPAGAGASLPLSLVWGWSALAVTIIAVWAGSVGGGPIFDDFFLVVRQDCFRTLEGMMSILRMDAGACDYRPGRYLSYGVDDAIFGGAFWGFHVGNIARHLLATAIAGGLATALARSAAPGAGGRAAATFGLIVAAVWALHPVQTDSVSYVSGRRDILAGLWTMAAVWSALVADRRGGLWWLVPLWCTLFGFLAKESAVVVPALFALWKLRDSSVSAWVRGRVSTFVAIGLGFVLSFLMVLYRGVLASHSHMLDWWGGSITSNFATVAALQLHYIRHVFQAHPLIGDYKPTTIPLAESFADPRSLLGVALVVALVAVFFAMRSRRPLVAFGVGWYLVALAPVSHVFPHHELFAEHYLYIPLFGAVVAMVDAVRWGIERAPDVERWRRIMLGTLAALLVVSAVRIVDRNRDFRDERAFYENVVAHAPENLRASANLANIYFDAREWEAAADWLERLAPQWIPGSRDEMSHMSRLVEAAARAGRGDVARAAAAQLAENHPDAGFGHKWSARFAAEDGDMERAYQASLRWWETTRDPQAASAACMVARELGTSPPDGLCDSVGTGEHGADPGGELGVELGGTPPSPDEQGAVPAPVERPPVAPPEPGPREHLHGASHAIEALRAEPPSDPSPRDPAAITAWQPEARARLGESLGDSYEALRALPLDARVLETTVVDGVRREELSWVAEPGYRSRGYLFSPVQEEARAGILFLHGHTFGGHRAAAGIAPWGPEDPHHAGALALARRGFVVLAPAMRTFEPDAGERDHIRFVNAAHVAARVPMGIFATDARRALDVLSNARGVDADRLGVTGLSVGGLLSLVTAALDDRVDAAVVAGFLTSYRGGLVERFACPCQFGGVLGGAYDVADIAAMRAPAPLMFVAGRMDGDIPFAEQQAGFQRIFEVWSALGAERAAAFVAHDGGHEYLAAPAAAFFETHLIRTDVD